MTALQFAKRLEALNWSQALTAEYLVRHERTVRRWVHGERRIPKIVADAIGSEARCQEFERWLVETGQASGDVARRTLAERLAAVLVKADLELARDLFESLEDLLVEVAG